MQDPSTLGCALSIAGLAGIGLLPLRTWQAHKLFAARLPWRSSIPIKLLWLVMGAGAGLAVALDIYVAAGALRSLIVPSDSVGWLPLAILGMVYLGFEALVAVVLTVSRRLAIRYTA
ncbi:hypothetical protein LVB77_09250 [Lysobacter sp. 5GHs7-4]|uniref:hypothetical protein n=1 Tax=Lysobacter sp. 5GHs7-4 TaxID=2904253 RepID=UPI001E28F7B3|nr:hypothetical protein [Lysobacter sp. 5GHs7-4]UHQ24836.1 hypothetical protein LVB77_09250 [Lysobacter sp. 5GHs7-4]